MAFGSLLAFSIIALITGASGMTCACGPCKPASTCYRVWPILYGVALFFVWLIYFIVGGIVTGISTTGPQMIQDVCDGNIENTDWISEGIEEVDITIGSYQSQMMCSLFCPCSALDAQPWLDMQEDELNEWKRTKKPVTNTGTINRDPVKDD